MRKFRGELFESNSSQTHSLVVLAKEDYDKWKEGGYYLYLYEDLDNDMFYPEGCDDDESKMSYLVESKIEEKGTDLLYSPEALKGNLMNSSSHLYSRFLYSGVDPTGVIDALNKVIGGKLSYNDPEVTDKLVHLYTPTTLKEYIECHDYTSVDDYRESMVIKGITVLDEDKEYKDKVIIGYYGWY